MYKIKNDCDKYKNEKYDESSSDWTLQVYK